VLRRLRQAGVRFRTLSTVSAVDGTRVTISDTVTGEESETTADLVVVKTMLAAQDELARELDGSGPALVAIGDAAAPRRISHAVLEANVALRRFEEGRLNAVAVALT
jgi:2,4-dienoyl-CoA reductase (NADPH2)